MEIARQQKLSSVVTIIAVAVKGRLKGKALSTILFT